VVDILNTMPSHDIKETFIFMSVLEMVHVDNCVREYLVLIIYTNYKH